MTRAELDYLNAIHASLFGAPSRPATQGDTHNERIVPSDVEPSVQTGAVGRNKTAAPISGGEE